MNMDKTAVVAESATLSGPVEIGPEVFIADGARIVGDVALGENSSVWYNAVIRSDQSYTRIGARVNIQDNCVLHVEDNIPTVLGDDVSIGHGAIVHSCTVGDRSLIGMGAVLLNNVHVGRDCLVGAGSLVTAGTVIPDGHLAFGNPARIRRPLTETEIRENLQNARDYLGLARKEKESRAAQQDTLAAPAATAQ